jgi:hypothetical protein
MTSDQNNCSGKQHVTNKNDKYHITDNCFCKNTTGQASFVRDLDRNFIFTMNTPGRSRWPRGLRRRYWPLGCWNRGFESCSRHGCLSLRFCIVLSWVGTALCEGWSLVQSSPIKYLITITKPPVWDGQGPYKDCTATAVDEEHTWVETSKLWENKRL